MQYGFFLTTYVVLWGLFLAFMRIGNLPWPQQIELIDVLLLSLATFRITEVITEEKVALFLRAPFCEKVRVQQADGSWDEEEVPKGRGLRRVAGELILCPWCAGVWIATLLSFFWIAAPTLARVVLLVFAVAAGGLIFQILAKLLDRTRKSLPQ